MMYDEFWTRTLQEEALHFTNHFLITKSLQYDGV